MNIYVDMEGDKTHGGTIPPSILVTEQRPDLVITSPDNVTIVELTVPFDTNAGIDAARVRKTSRYSNLEYDLIELGYSCDVIFVEIGSRGLITKSNKQSMTFLAKKLGISKISNFIAMSGRSALEGSRVIFNARNSPHW